MADYITKSLACFSLPGDLMVDILCRLPVKSLTRFKSVNKSWYFVIKNRVFMRMHYDHVSKLEDESFILLSSHSIGSELGLIKPGSNRWESLGIKEPGEYEIVGASKGLICLTKLGTFFGHYFSVWNPALGSSKSICFRSNINHQCKIAFVSIGFGYDEVGDDFKIVKVEVLFAASRSSIVHVYSFRKNIWKTGESLTDFALNAQFPTVTLGSCMYWPALTFVGNGARLAVFNLNTETFHVSCPFPGQCSNIVALRQESLALIFDGNEKTAGVWTMSKQGYDIVKQVDCDWLTMHPCSAENYFCLLRKFCGKVVSSRRDGDFLVINLQKISLYSPKDHKLTPIVQLSLSRLVLQVWCFKESLFSLN